MMFIDYLVDILHRFYYYLFDRLILYPMLRLLCFQFNIRFMNLGYQCTADEKFPILEKYAKEDECKANIALYEKTLSLHPNYPNFTELHLLEVGCGQGGGIDWLLKAHCSSKAVIGIDPVVVDSRHGMVVTGNAEQLPLANDSFDIILNIESSHLYANCQQFFRECSRILRKNGVLCWADLRYAHQLEATMWEAEQSGLQLIKLEDVTAQVLKGIESTSIRYDAMLQEAPYLVRLFQESIRTTYCAPGTRSHQRLLQREKIYVCACWCNRKKTIKT